MRCMVAMKAKNDVLLLKQIFTNTHNQQIFSIHSNLYCSHIQTLVAHTYTNWMRTMKNEKKIWKREENICCMRDMSEKMRFLNVVRYMFREKKPFTFTEPYDDRSVLLHSWSPLSFACAQCLRDERD